MLRNNLKVLFWVLLIPTYLNIIIILFSFTSGLSIEWKYFVISIILNFLGAWSLSIRRSILLNIFGLALFCIYGWPLFSYLFKHSNIGPWKINVITGSLIIALGLISFVCVIVKRIREHLVN